MRSFTLFRILFLLVTLFCGLQAMEASLQVVRCHEEWCAAHAPSGAAWQKSRRLLGKLSLHYYQGDRREDARQQELKRREDEAGGRADRYSLLLALLACGFFALELGRALHNRDDGETFLHDLLLFSLFLLVLGLLCPVLRLEAGQRILGEDVVFKQQSKSILGTVQVLFASGNGMIASLVFLFSFFLPLVKIVYGFRALDPRPLARRRAVGFLTLVGKWSMVDVFVIANLLAVFAIHGVDRSTDARIGHGTLFFAAYCLLSLVTGIGLAWHARRLEGEDGNRTRVADVASVRPLDRSTPVV